MAAKGRDIGVSFSVAQTQLLHLRTPCQRTSPSKTPIELENLLLRPSEVVSWRGYWFTPTFNMTHHYRHPHSLAQPIFSFVMCLSSPGAGVRPLHCHRIANGLLLPILTYGADLITPNYAALRGMNGFWHRVQRWTTNNLFSTPTSILSREACLTRSFPTAGTRGAGRPSGLPAPPRTPTRPQPDSRNASPPSHPLGPRTLPGTLR